MSRRQSLDRPGILSPPGPFLTPSPSPSISASPRLQPSPSLSPFPQDVLLLTSNSIGNNNSQDLERKAVTPCRRQSIHQFANGSPNAGAVVFQPSPSQSPAATTSIVSVTAGGPGTLVANIGTTSATTTGNECNTTLVGSNNIQLNNNNKKINKRTTGLHHQQQQNHHHIFNSGAALSSHIATSTSSSAAGGYGQSHSTAIATSSSFASANVASSPRAQTKKSGAALVLPVTLAQQHSQQLQQQQYHSNSPLIADSPSPSPSHTITAAATVKPGTPQPQPQQSHSQSVQMLAQQFTITSSAPQNAQQHVFQFIQGPQGQIIAAPASQQQPQRVISGTPITQGNMGNNGGSVTNTTKVSKLPQQILPKPQQQQTQNITPPPGVQQQQQRGKNSNLVTSVGNMLQMPQLPQMSQAPHQTQINVTGAHNPSTQQQQQIILPTTQQPLLLNQMPVLVQQNTPQGVQLILRPPTPQLTTAPSLVIQNARPQPQLQQQQPQQVLRILGANGATMQLTAAAPTFIVSSQANLLPQSNQLQTIKTSPQGQAITQLSGLHAALSAAAAANSPRSQQFTTAATINSHLLGQLQNLQLAAAANGGSITQIQVPNGLSGTSTPTTAILSQLPAQFQQSIGGQASGLINLSQLNGANIQQLAAAAAAAGATFQTPQAPSSTTSSTSDLLSTTSNHLPHSSAVGQIPLAVPSDPLRQSTPILQAISSANSQSHPQLQNGATLINASAGTVAAATIQLQQQQHQQQQVQIQQLQQQLQHTQSQVQQAQQQQQLQQSPSSEAKKRPKPRKKKSLLTGITSSGSGSIAPSTTSMVSTQSSSTICNSTTIASNKFSALHNSTGDSTMAEQKKVTETNVISAMSTTYPPKSPTPQITRASNGKLDLGNVMKLCGIMEDDDDDEFDVDLINQSQAHMHESAPTTSNDITISIPNHNGTDNLPFTLTIPASATAPSDSTSGHVGGDTPNILIKIDQNDTTTTPYTISIPRLPTAEEIQLQAQQHLAQQAAAAAAQKQQQPLNSTKSNATGLPTMHFGTVGVSNLATAAAFKQPNSCGQQIPTITAQNPSINKVSHPTADNSSSRANSTPSTMASNAAVVSTATIKPRRKPTARRMPKKLPEASTVSATTAFTAHSTSTSSNVLAASNIMCSTPTSTGHVPSQIGNIQISQVDASKVSTLGASNTVENKIQITPILDNAVSKSTFSSNNNNTGPTLQQQMSQIAFHPPTSVHSNASSSNVQQLHSLNTNTIPATILPTTITCPLPNNMSLSVGSPSAAALVPQLTGSLTLAVSEHCERLILRHDPNQPQDQQSHLILQALLKGALPNLTIINEPTKLDTNKVSAISLTPQTPVGNQQQSLQTANVQKSIYTSASRSSTNNVTKPSAIQLQLGTTPIGSNQVSCTGLSHLTGDTKRTVYVESKSSAAPQTRQNESVLQQQQQQPSSSPAKCAVNQTNVGSNTVTKLITTSTLTTATVTQNQQRYVALPKIDPSTQQLFCLNSVNNQITPINAAQTTASIGPTERLLIAPAGINAQQLAQCLQQGQIHFNDVNPLPTPLHQPSTGTNTSITPYGGGSCNQARIQPPQQQIVHPQPIQTPACGGNIANSSGSGLNTGAMSSLSVTKQVANVAPIIDQSKAKLDPPKVSKKKPVRKSKATELASGTTAGLSKNAGLVKPMPKLDPLSQKPNNNPVQIVQPNVASGKIIATSSSNVTTTTSTTTNSTIQPFQSLQQTTNGTKLVGVTAPMQLTLQLASQQQEALPVHPVVQQRGATIITTSNTATSSTILDDGVNTSCTPVVSTIASTVSTNALAPPVSATSQLQQSVQQQHTISRVQTIQLTPQQQQMFKQVQMQVQYLTIKLQHKTLLTSFPLPAELDAATIAPYNKSMTDSEINTALQRLFVEQQRILASGKEIPTPENLLHSSNLANAALASGSLTTAQEQQGDTNKNNSAQNIPAHIVQPNNHSVPTLTSNTSTTNTQQPGTVTHRIHIYPMQHSQSLQQNKQQQKQQKLIHQPIASQPNQLSGITPSTKTKDTTVKIKQIPAPQLQQKHSEHTHLKATYPNATNSLQTQSTPIAPKAVQHMNLNTPCNGPPPLIFPTSLSATTGICKTVLVGNIQQQQPQQQPVSMRYGSSYTAPVPSLVATTAALSSSSNTVVTSGNDNVNVSTAVVTTSTTNTIVAGARLNNLIGIRNLVPGDIVAASMSEKPAEDGLSSKPKLARLSLFIRQLEVDQRTCLNPDYRNPFQNKEEAVKRLIRYHCLYEDDEDLSLRNEQDDEFFHTATMFQDKFRSLTDKYQHIIKQESTLLHRTSELCQIQQLMVDDMREEMAELRHTDRDTRSSSCNEFKPIKPDDTINYGGHLAPSPPIIMDIKEEIKVEPADSKGSNTTPENNTSHLTAEKLVKTGSVDGYIVEGNTSSNKAFNSATKKDAVNVDTSADAQMKKDFEQFDIESEITPSFILKKIDLREGASIKSNTVNSIVNDKTNLYDNSGIINTYDRNAVDKQSHDQQELQKQQQEDEWLCIQKELNLMNNDKSQQKMLDSLFESSTSAVDLFPNGCIQSKNNIDGSDRAISQNQASCSRQRQQPNNHHMSNISEFFVVDGRDTQKSVETRLEAMFGSSPVHMPKKNAEAHDIESRLDEIFGDAKSPGVSIPKSKRLWEQELAAAATTFIPSANSNPAIYEHDQPQQIHQLSEHQQIFSNNHAQHTQTQEHIQMNCSSGQWNIDAQFNEFMGTTNGLECRKRNWNSQIITASDLDSDTNCKKMCTTSSDSSTSASPLSQSLPPHSQLTNTNILDTADMLTLHDDLDSTQPSSRTNGFSQILMHQSPQAQHTQTFAQTHGHQFIHTNIAAGLETPQYVPNHQHDMHAQQQHVHQHGSQLVSCNAPEFDDDISRHVQNAIDSILNLQNSESDSLPFSLDHSMGSFLGESILDDRQQMNSLPNCHETGKRRLLVDELGDCLLNTGTASTIGNNNSANSNGLHNAPHHSLVNHSNNHSNHSITIHSGMNHSAQLHQPQQQLPHQQSTGISDFNCVTDERVKSLLTS